MKNRKLLYVLVPLVLGIWGIIIYKIINGIATDVPVLSARPEMNEELNKGNEALKDSFNLLLDYRDPFENLSAPKTVSTSTIKKRIILLILY